MPDCASDIVPDAHCRRDFAGSAGRAGSGAGESADGDGDGDGGDDDDGDGDGDDDDADGVAAGFEPPEHAVAATSRTTRITTRRIRSG
jgi:hypothetical protein